MKWTLYRKIRLLIVGILLTVVLVEFGLVARSGQQSVNRLIDDAASSADLLSSSVNTFFSDVNQTISYLEPVLSVHSAGDPKMTRHLKNIAESRREILNIFIAYENGEFWIHPEAEDLPKDFNVTTRPWFVSAFGTDEIQWSRPYDDAATKSVVITASKEVQLLDRKAVVGIDLSLSTIHDMMHTLNKYSDGWVTIFNQAEVIASTDGEMLDMTVADLTDSELRNNFPYYGTFLMGDGLYIARRIPEVDLIIVQFAPDDYIYGHRRDQLIFSGLAILLVLVVGIIVSHFITKKFTQPLSNLKDAIVQSSDQEEMIYLNEVTNDEINVLIKEYNHLANHINDQNQKIFSLAYEDELTGLMNRYRFRETISERLDQELQTSLFYIDLDNFKYINDTYGHSVGDQVLQRVADRLQSFVVSTEAIARISGDEFGLSIETCDGEYCDRIGTQLINSLSRPYFVGHLSLHVTISIGIATYPNNADNYDDLLANAEIALYKAKELGKDGYVYFDKTLYKRFLQEIEVETSLLQAIAKDQIFPNFQPLIDLRTKEIIGFEALARWIDQERGPIYPDIFIPIAERNLSIIPLGWHILEKALSFGRQLYKETNKYYEVNVNVSVIQLMEDKFVDGVLAMLQKHDYPAKYLNLEITESVTLESNEESMLKLAYLRKKDINISLDDFGTGYSSLGHLTDLSLSHIKIDRQLILKAKQSAEVFTLMEGIVGFAHKIGNSVVAEGIEDIDMEEMVLAMNADFGQGYWYGKPMSDQDFINVLSDQKEEQN